MQRSMRPATTCRTCPVAEVPGAWAEGVLSRFEDVSEEEASRGAALGAPPWRWWPPSQRHAGLTVIRYDLDGPPAVLVSNDMAHLPAALRWTGFPDHLRV